MNTCLVKSKGRFSAQGFRLGLLAHLLSSIDFLMKPVTRQALEEKLTLLGVMP